MYFKNDGKYMYTYVIIFPMYTLPGSDIGVFSKELIWEYLVSRNMTDVIVAWIHNSFTSNRPGSHTEKEVKWPVSHLGKVSADFVNQLDLCTVRSKNEILNAFAR